jgi:hypothetical protein
MANSEPFEFAKYRRPQFEGPLSRTRAAESDDDQMPAENLGDLLHQVSKNSMGIMALGDRCALLERVVALSLT